METAARSEVQVLPEFDRDELCDAVKRLFERHFEDQEVVYHDVTAQDDSELRLADFVFVDASGDLHFVQIQRTFDEAFFTLRHGLHAMTNADANVCWLALPLDEYRAGNELFDNRIEEACKARGIGIVGVYRCGRGVSARVYVEPTVRGGRFLADHPDLEAVWQRQIGAHIVNGRKPGDYYVVSDHI